jgi:CheY-like chemotaxis protein
LKALVVSSDDPGGEVLAVYLRQNGWLADRVQGPEEALARLPSYCPDVLVIDHLPPGMDGIELLNVLREEQATEELPVLFLSAGPDYEVTNLEAAAQALGPAAVLRKTREAPEAVLLVMAQLTKGGG